MEKLFVLSVDSLWIDDMGWLEDCPNLLEIYERSARVKRVESVLPAMTYAAHATMLTGCYPRRHGIYHNETICPGDPHPAWHWRRKSIRVPTIIDAAWSSGYRCAAVHWPVTGADPHIAYNIPEIWTDTQEEDVRPRFISVCSQPVVELFDRHRHLLNWDFLPELDEFGTACLADVVRTHRPECIFYHLSYLDYCRHRFGRYSEAAKNALVECDRRFGRIVSILKEQGTYNETNFVVVGDHGHLPIERTVHPNVLLAREGLIRLGENSSVQSWKAYCHSAGLTCQVSLADPGDPETRRRVQELLEAWVRDRRLGCEGLLRRPEFVEEYGLDGPFDFVLVGGDGTAFGNRCDGEPVYFAGDPRAKMHRSGHGHMPAKGPQPTLFAAGPRIRSGVVLPTAKLVDEAPTWAALLSVELPSAEGRTLSELLL